MAWSKHSCNTSNRCRNRPDKAVSTRDDSLPVMGYGRHSRRSLGIEREVRREEGDTSSASATVMGIVLLLAFTIIRAMRQWPKSRCCSIM
jgi:hypothetical protein